ncbi:hypothetical protein [Clostridium beijerinckii]|uniref:Uncharacterized protein n=1 Tax=Clostridium beijerinckii TaxID=1520 RepID=A0AAE5LN55_CLOBE|nr:hypothetical protein [Clostridium beijerinckii]NSB12097.1 hypothetical protein [Clostridium beijerinckii]OOM27431.1 hypothetical protein CLOBE_29890 [Clostridium beijerinckii]
MEYVVNREMEFGLKDLFVKANDGAENFIEWLKGLNGLKETEKADNVKKLVDDARSNDSEIFNSCTAVYDEKNLKVTLFKTPEILTSGNGKPFTHAETQRSTEYTDFTCFLLNAVMEEFKLAIVNFQAYLDFDEETDLEEDLEKQIKIATTEEDKYSFIEEIAGIKFDDWDKHLVSAYFEDLDEQRMFAKFDNGIEVMIDRVS